MEKKQNIEKINDICNLINSVPIDDYSIVLDIAAIIVKNFFDAESSIIYLSDLRDNNYSFYLVSHSIPFEKALKTDSYEPLPNFKDILKREKPVVIKASRYKDDSNYLGDTAFVAPLIANGKPFGILLVNNPQEDTIEEQNNIYYEMIFTLLSNLIYNAILLKEKSSLLKELDIKHSQLAKSIYQVSELTMSIISTLEDASLFRDQETGVHILRVRKYSKIIAQSLNLDKDLIYKIDIYAGIHDIGKLAIKYEILAKPDKYTSDEYAEMKRHSELGFDLINRKGIDDVAKNIVLYHHERYDGKGYPYGKTGSKIPIEARVVALADVYDALTSERVYKESYTNEEAETYIRDEKGKHFDPDVVDAFFDNIEEIRKIKDLLR